MRAIFHLIIMISCLLLCAHQTHNRINVYHVIIISYLYLTLYYILHLSYPDHQTDPKLLSLTPLLLNQTTLDPKDVIGDLEQYPR